MARELGIPEANEVTFAWTRHTSATTLKKSGVSIEIISEIMNHKNIRTRQIYLDSFDQEQLDKTFEHLL